MKPGAGPHGAATGLLSVVATPIGNLGDLPKRAAEALAAADAILCEDTRHTGQLLHHLGIKKPLERLDAHTEQDRVAGLVARLQAGARLALVSDAGTPCLSDPGARLVDAVQDAGIPVESLPGPFAAAVALAASGLNPQPFAFWGFLAKKSGERQRQLQARLLPGPDGPMTHAFYVPGRDLVEVLADVAAVAPQARVCVARELTKLYEEYLRGAPAAVAAALTEEQQRGEAVLLIEVAEVAAPPPPVDAADLVRVARQAGEDRKFALRRIGEKTGLSRNELYELWLAAGDSAAENDPAS